MLRRTSSDCARSVSEQPAPRSTSPLRSVIRAVRKRGRCTLILDAAGAVTRAAASWRTASTRTELGSIPISNRALSDALNGILASSLRQVCVGLALFYALLTAWYLVQLKGPAQTSMSLSTALLSFGLLVGAVWFERNQLPRVHGAPGGGGHRGRGDPELPVLAGERPRRAPDDQLDDRPARVRLPAVVDAVVHRARRCSRSRAGCGSRARVPRIPTGTTSASRCSRPRCSAGSCCSCVCARTATSRPCACATRCWSRTCARRIKPR